ncbi:hypothetical protein A9Q99_18165 [Gammaproteobacteria bacterium 45_16_T64]|nr:hypothetical protein A9Q99_18165 [Gammaproteobacteria bacterium 45_16_T64]
MSSRSAVQLVHIGFVLLIIAFISAALAESSTTHSFKQQSIDHLLDDAGVTIISDMDPAQGALVGRSYIFSAIVKNSALLRSVTFVVEFPDGVTKQDFRASKSTEDNWSVSIRGFGDGDWRWWVVAKDERGQNGYAARSEVVSFSVGRNGGEIGERADPTSILGEFSSSIVARVSRSMNILESLRFQVFYKCLHKRKPDTKFCLGPVRRHGFGVPGIK